MQTYFKIVKGQGTESLTILENNQAAIGRVVRKNIPDHSVELEHLKCFLKEDNRVIRHNMTATDLRVVMTDSLTVDDSLIFALAGYNYRSLTRIQGKYKFYFVKS